MRLNLSDKGQKKIGFSYAWNGLSTVLKRERNFRIHIFAAILVVSVGLLVKLSPIEWLIICLTITIVLVTEIVNSAIEKTIDYISKDEHPDAKNIKDMAAGAVLIAAIASIIIGVIIFLPKISHLLF